MKLRQVQAWFEEAELAAIDKPGVGEKASENDFGIEPLVENLFFNQSRFLSKCFSPGTADVPAYPRPN